MNTEISHNGIEIYMCRLMRLADEYIEQRLQGKAEDMQKNFRDFIFYASDRIQVPDYDDIDSLDNLFQSYVRLCVRYQKLPTVQCFSWLTKIHRSTLNDWENGLYRASTPNYADIVKEWKETCKSFVIDELQNNSATNVNLIFVSKACYGLRETSPLPVESNETRRVLSAAELPRLSPPEKEDY